MESCAACRDDLEQLAGAPQDWQQVEEFLSDESFELAPLSQCGISEEAENEDAHGRLLNLLGPSDDPRMLGRLGTYEVAGVIGSGGMGVVLKAFDHPLNRFVAIKVLAPHLATSAAARRRFSREAQAAAAIVHENVIEIHGVDAVDGLPYLVMPYVRGSSLQKRLHTAGPLSLLEILRIAKQAAAGLAAAHAQGLVHRDVKPANILLAEGVERVTLTDFGLARAADDASLTNTGVIAGTPQYMSPEQARGDRVDHRSDLFSLGSVIYAMATGHPPFRAESSYAVLRRICDAEPRPISERNAELPAWLWDLVHKLLAKSPEDRFESAEALDRILGQCLAHVQQPTTHQLPTEVRRLGNSKASGEAPRKSPWLVAAVLISLVALVIGFTATGWHAPPPAEDDSGSAEPTPTATKEDTSVDPSLLEWDLIEHELDELNTETESLEESTRSLLVPNP